MRISDWSSDVCSSDLLIIVSYPAPSGRARIRRQSIVPFAVFASRRIAPECGEFCQDVVRRMSWVRHRKGEPDEGIRYHRLRRDWLYRPARLRTFGSKLRRSEEHTSELQSLMRISYAVFCLKKKKK